MIFNANSIWNKPIGANPVIKSEFSAMLARQPKFGINGVTDFGIPIWDVDASTPRVRVFNEPGRSEIIPVPSGILASPISDGFLIIRDIAAALDLRRNAMRAKGVRIDVTCTRVS